jgi:hypothetical protein
MRRSSRGVTAASGGELIDARLGLPDSSPATRDQDQRRAPRRRIGRRRTAALAAWVLVTLIGSAWWAAPPAAVGAAANGEIVPRGYLPFSSPANGAIGLDSKARLFYVVDPQPPSKVIVRSADPPYDQLGSMPMPMAGGIRPLAVDEEHHRLFIAVTPSTPLTSTSPKPLGTPARIVIVDGPSRRVLGVVQVATTKVANVSAAQQVFLGTAPSIAYDPVHDKVYASSAINSGTGSVVFQVDPEKVIHDWGGPGTELTSVDWAFLLPECERQVSSFGGWPGRHANDVVVACTGLDQLVAAQPEATQGVFRIPLHRDSTGLELPPDSTTAVQLTPFPGSYVNGRALYDPVGGRAVMFSAVQGGASIAVVFDVAHDAFVGLVRFQDTSDILNACVDRSSGRFYAFTKRPLANNATAQDQGLVVGEARAVEIPYPQGFGFPELFDGFPDNNGAAVCDPVGRRVYRPLADKIRILEDQVTPYVPTPDPRSPDLDTTDGTYDPARTRLTFVGSGRAYGAQVELVGGYGAVAGNFQGVQPSGTLGLSPGSPVITLATSGLPGEPGDVGASNAQFVANAAPATRDRGTQSNLTPGTPENAPVKGRVPDVWPYKQVTCAAPAEGKASSMGAPDASVICDPATQSAKAVAVFPDVFNLYGAIRITGAESSVTTAVDAATGLLTTTSVARVGAVSLNEGTIELEDVMAVAKTTAGGRTGTAHGSFLRSIGRFAVDGKTVCGKDPANPANDNPCDPKQVADQINAMPQATVRASFPAPDGVEPPGDGSFYAIAGTPKGAKAAVVRDRWQQVNDQAMNEVMSFDRVIPALRLMIGSDTYRHSYLMVSLAEPMSFSQLTMRPCVSCKARTTPTTARATDTSDVVAKSANVPTGNVPSRPAAPAAAPDAANDEVVDDVAEAPVEEGRSSPEESAFESTYDVPPAQPASDDGGGSIADRLGNGARNAARQVARGLAIVATSPTRLVQLLLIWAVIGLPIYLSSRRQLVLRGMGL